jgi:hypothetical protein
VFDGFDQDSFFHVMWSNQAGPAGRCFAPDGRGDGGSPFPSVAFRHSSTGLWFTSARHCRKDSSRAVLLAAAPKPASANQFIMHWL